MSIVFIDLQMLLCLKKPLTVSYVAQGGQQATIAPTYKPVDDS